jgi:hypothetical protein
MSSTIPNIEQQQQTKAHYNTKYWSEATNRNQLQYQIFNSRDKQKPTIIPNIEQQQQTETAYNTKYWTTRTNKIQL